jgi:hypothetical protein
MVTGYTPVKQKTKMVSLGEQDVFAFLPLYGTGCRKAKSIIHLNLHSLRQYKVMQGEKHPLLIPRIFLR